MTLEKVLSNLIYSDSYTGRFSTGENSLASYPFPDDGKEAMTLLSLIPMQLSTRRRWVSMLYTILVMALI